MIAVTLDQLYGWINALLWPLVRVLAVLGTAPLFGENAVPARVKVGLGVLITLAILPGLGPMPAVAPTSWQGLSIVLWQVLIGISIGLAMRVVFYAVQIAGEIIGLQMGLSFATFFDPGTNSNTSVLSRLFNMVTLMIFLALDAHLLLLAGLQHSFSVLPIAPVALGQAGVGEFVAWAGQVMILGLVLALPLVTALLTMNLSMGILNRTAPQLSVFAVGFPLSLLAGMVMLTIVLPQTTPVLERLFTAAFEAVGRILDGYNTLAPP